MNTKLNIEIKKNNEKLEYQASLNFMEKRVFEIINQNKEDLIWFLNYENIYTIGASGSDKDILQTINIPVLKTNRGGKVTYHGPGQRIVYFLMDLKKRKKDIRKFVSTIEISAIKLLKEFNIEATTFSDRVGIWVVGYNNKKLCREKKIGAIGLRVKKWVTYHGLSFNLKPNLKYYEHINACGLSNYSSTSMKSLGIDLSEKDFDEIFLKIFLKEIKNL